MSTLTRAVALAGLVGLTMSSFTRAAVNVGDTPSFDVIGMDGAPLSLEKYRGKIVIVDFWATWCGPCMAEADHMVSLHKEFGPRGVQLIGISLDDDETTLKSVIRKAGFNWPQFYDGNGWKNQLAVQWGVQSIPATFILDPEGKVVWKGHPARIDAVLATAMANTPPMAIDPAVAREASAKLDEIEKLVAQSPADALNRLVAIPVDAKKVDELGARIAKVESSLQEYAKTVIGEADALIGQGKFEEAAVKLDVVIAGLPKTDAGKLASEKLAAIASNPEYIRQKETAAKAKADAEKLAAAETALKDARALASRNRHEDAYAAYRAIASRFAGTPIAEQAAAAVAKYESDKTFMRTMNDKAAKSQAEGMLSLARNYARTNAETAMRKYREIINTFPDTSFAVTAKKELATLEAKSTKKE